LRGRLKKSPGLRGPRVWSLDMSERKVIRLLEKSFGKEKTRSHPRCLSGKKTPTDQTKKFRKDVPREGGGKPFEPSTAQRGAKTVTRGEAPRKASGKKQTPGGKSHRRKGGAIEPHLFLWGYAKRGSRANDRQSQKEKDLKGSKKKNGIEKGATNQDPVSKKAKPLQIGAGEVNCK